jgi:hypothetical protein
MCDKKTCVSKYLGIGELRDCGIQNSQILKFLNLLIWETPVRLP